jgi:flagellar hook-basal body complex protein FliE
MDINQIQSVGPTRPSSPTPFETDQIKKDETFGDMLKNAIGQVNGLQTDADNQMYKLAVGDVKDVHEVMLAMEKANISLQLTLEIRDRVVEAWQAMMRIAV